MNWLILSIDDKISSSKVAFNLVKGFKSNDDVDGNPFMAWERLKNKFEVCSQKESRTSELKN
jgi:hypothetical protein